MRFRGRALLPRKKEEEEEKKRKPKMKANERMEKMEEKYGRGKRKREMVASCRFFLFRRR